MGWNKAKGLADQGKKLSNGPRATRRAVLTVTLAMSSLLIINTSGASAQTATPTPATTGNNSSTSTSADVTSPTSTSTKANTTGNVTVTGGAGAGATSVNIYQPGSSQPGAAAAPGTACQYQLGFTALHNLIPAIVLGCLTDETHNVANGDGLQNSAAGLLVWRKADNWTAFTDGYRTWINGPFGIQQRLNTLRYSWEANPDNLPAA